MCEISIAWVLVLIMDLAVEVLVRVVGHVTVEHSYLDLGLVIIGVGVLRGQTGLAFENGQS